MVIKSGGRREDYGSMRVVDNSTLRTQNLDGTSNITITNAVVSLTET